MHMFVELLITFRETFEAVLIIGIILSYLKKINHFDKKKFVIGGAMLGLLFSILGAIVFQVVLGGFEGQVEESFEGIMMIIGAIMITTLIVWLHRQSKSFTSIETKIDHSLNNSQSFGIFFLAFISVFREGIETVLFLSASSISQDSYSFLGAILGIGIALIVGILVYKGAIRINIQLFFKITSLFLIFVAAGLFSYGIHELQEANLIPILNEHIYDINLLINEKGVVGSLLNSIFGYNGNPSLIETLSYLSYLGVILSIYFGIPLLKQKNTSKSSTGLGNSEAEKREEKTSVEM
jgi:high-affinity iron transporter